MKVTLLCLTLFVGWAMSCEIPPEAAPAVALIRTCKEKHTFDDPCIIKCIGDAVKEQNNGVIDVAKFREKVNKLDDGNLKNMLLAVADCRMDNDPNMTDGGADCPNYKDLRDCMSKAVTTNCPAFAS